MRRSLLARVRSVPGRLLDAALRAQSRAAGLVSVHGHHLFAPPLSAASVVIDAGANVGGFSSGMVDRFGCLCYAVEPVPELFARIPEGPRVRRFPLALGGADGEVVLHLSGNPEGPTASTPASPRASGSRGSWWLWTSPPSTASSPAPAYRAPTSSSWTSMGSEIALLESVREETLERIGQITVEFHDFLEGSRDGEAIAALKRRLRRARFLCVVLSRPSSHHGGHPVHQPAAQSSRRAPAPPSLPTPRHPGAAPAPFPRRPHPDPWEGRRCRMRAS